MRSGYAVGKLSDICERQFAFPYLFQVGTIAFVSGMLHKQCLASHFQVDALFLGLRWMDETAFKRMPIEKIHVNKDCQRMAISFNPGQGTALV